MALLRFHARRALHAARATLAVFIAATAAFGFCDSGFAVEAALDAGLHEEIVRVPVSAAQDGIVEQWSLVATLFRPSGAGPFPVVVLNHGSPGAAWERQAMGRYRPLPQIREFTRRGFAVIAPMRRGYGDTGGEWAERYGTCFSPDYYHASREAAKDVIGTVRYAQSLPFVRRDQVLLVGQSAGGIAAIAAASENPPGVLGVVNFSGGRGGRPYTNPGDPCVAANMTQAIARLSSSIKVPVLWHYSENDQFFSPRNVRAWFKAFQDSGGVGKLVMQPPFQWDGHGIFGAVRGLPIWTAAFDGFLKDLHYSAAAVPAVTPIAGHGHATARPAQAPVPLATGSGT